MSVESSRCQFSEAGGSGVQSRAGGQAGEGEEQHSLLGTRNPAGWDSLKFQGVDGQLSCLPLFHCCSAISNTSKGGFYGSLLLNKLLGP